MRIDPGTFGAGKSQICQLPDWTWIETNGESGYVLQQPLASEGSGRRGGPMKSARFSIYQLSIVALLWPTLNESASV